MRRREDLKKTAAKVLYHVTPTANVASIRAKGILPMQTSNWTKGPGGERYGGGEIFAMDDAEDAVRWAAKMDWDLNRAMGTGKVSVVSFTPGAEKWEADTSDPVQQAALRGRWLKAHGSVKPGRVTGAVPVTLEMTRALVAGKPVKLGAGEPALATRVRQLWRRFKRLFPENDYEKSARHQPQLVGFIMDLAAALAGAREGSLFEDHQLDAAARRLDEANDAVDRGFRKLAVILTRWAFAPLVAEADPKRQYRRHLVAAGGPADFERLKARWDEFYESTKLGDRRGATEEKAAIGRALPKLYWFAAKLREAEKEAASDSTLFGGSPRLEGLVVPNVREALKYLKQVEEDMGADPAWAHRQTRHLGDTLWDYDAARGALWAAFHNIDVEYQHMHKTAGTKSYGHGTPIGGTPNEYGAADPGELQGVGDELEGTEELLTVSASVGKEAASYDEMFAQLLATPAGKGLRGNVKDEIDWARRTLRKQDRVTWWLRWYRLWLESRTRGLGGLLKRDLAAYSAKAGAPVSKADLPQNLEDLRGYLEHLMGLKDAAVQDVVWGYETPRQLRDKFEVVEQELAEKAESERRVIPQDQDEDPEEPPYSRHGEDPEVWIQFPNGWVWMNLGRAYCSAEAKAMGHCGNSPRSDTSDRILSLREPVEKGGRKYWSPHCTFILRGGAFLGEMKGRNNAKPTARYHPYIVALLKDDRIKGIMGGGYKPRNNFHWSDLTREQQKEVIAANPAFGDEGNWTHAGKTEATLAMIAVALGIIDDEDKFTIGTGDVTFNTEMDAFVINEWPDVEDTVYSIGDDEARVAIGYVVDKERGGNAWEETPDDDDMVMTVSRELGYRAVRALQARAEKDDPELLRRFVQDQRMYSPRFELDLTEGDQLRSVLWHLLRNNANTWDLVERAFKAAANLEYKEGRIADLEYAITEPYNDEIVTDLRFGKDGAADFSWDARPVYEVVDYDTAARLASDPDESTDLAGGQMEIWMSEYDPSDRDGEKEEAAIDILETWLTKGEPAPSDPDQMTLKFRSSLLRRAYVDFHETTRDLPPSPFRRHLDVQEQDDIDESVMDGVKDEPRAPRKPKQIDPNLRPRVAAGAPLEGVPVGRRADNWKLYVYRPDGGFVGQYFCATKAKGVEMAEELFGPLSPRDLAGLDRVGAADVWDGDAPLAILRLTAWPRPPAVRPMEKRAGREDARMRDLRAEWFVDRAGEAEEEAKTQFMSEGYLLQEAQERKATMRELWDEMGEEYMASYYGYPYVGKVSSADPCPLCKSANVRAASGGDLAECLDCRGFYSLLSH